MVATGIVSAQAGVCGSVKMRRRGEGARTELRGARSRPNRSRKRALGGIPELVAVCSAPPDCDQGSDYC